MNNQDIAKIFYEIADYLEMEGVQFKPYAYQKVALALENLEEDIREIYEKGGEKAIEEIPGVGKNIGAKTVLVLTGYAGKDRGYEDIVADYTVDNLYEAVEIIRK